MAIIVWFVVNHSMTVTKTVQNIPVRVINLSPHKTIEGMQVNGILNKRITLTFTGNKSALDDLSTKDIEVVIDASSKTDEWIAVIDKKNIVSLNPDLDLAKAISKVSSFEMIVRQSKLVTEKNSRSHHSTDRRSSQGIPIFRRMAISLNAHCKWSRGIGQTNKSERT